MKYLVTILILLFAAAMPAQEQAQKNDEKKPYFTIITHDDWAKRPMEKELVDAVTAQPTLGIARKCHFNHYTIKDDMYKHRWASIYPEQSLPAVVFQNPQGGYWYKASGQNVPRGSKNLFDEMQRYTMKTPKDQQPQPQEAESEDRPRIFPRRDRDGEEETPDSEESFVGRGPIRDTLGSGAMIMIGVVALAGLLAVTTLGLVLFSIINKVTRS
jgi:hypothetical protein